MKGEKGKHSTIDSGGIERLEGRQKNVSAFACDPATLPPLPLSS